MKKNNSLKIILFILFFLCYGNAFAQDTDGDGVSNTIDIDDDNDGILDTQEGFCVSQSVYTLNVASTLAGATIGINGGSFNLIYTLTSGVAVPSIGNSFSVPFTYSDFNNTVNTQNHTWSSFGGTTELRILPNTNSFYTNLPTNNTTAENIIGSSPEAWFRNLLNGGLITNLGTFTTTIGNLPIVTGTSSYSSNTPINMYSSFNVAAGAQLVNGYYAKMQLQNLINTTNTPNTVPFDVSYGNTYIWDYTAFSSTPGTGATNAGRGLINISVNTVTFCNHLDTDGDGTPNYLDLDSDNDGCSDAKEATVIPASALVADGSLQNAKFSFVSPANDTNNDGLYDGATQSTYSQYALSNTLNACKDTDGDGISDVIDIDDDNDGVLDTVELESCSINANSSTYKPTIIASTSATIATGTIQNLLNSTETTDFYYTSQVLNNTNIATYKFPSAVNLKGFETSTNGSSFINAGSSVKVQGSNDGSTWTDLTSSFDPSTTFGTSTYSLTANKTVKFLFSSNTSNYIYYRVLGISGGLTSGPWVYETYFSPISTLFCDTDGDGISNQLDLDSDGDGCSDAKEATVIPASALVADGSLQNAKFSFVSPANDTNNDGLYDGATQSTYSQYALSNTLNACADTDGDGIGDLVDIDDDNDGVLDTVEFQSCSINSSTYKPTIIASTSATIATGTIQNLLNSTETTDFYYTSQVLNNTNIATYKFPSAVNLKGFETSTNGSSFINAGSSVKVQGSNDGSTWTDLTSSFDPSTTFGTSTYSLTANKTVKFMFSNNTSNYIYYRVLGISGGLTSGPWVYETYFSPISPLLCDTDGDGTPNYLDLDSDGDGCSDAKEATVTPASALVADGSLQNAKFSFVSPSNDTNNDGLYDGATQSTYIQYAINSSLNACLDSDGDGIGDLVDVDDDNDGILDTVESPTLICNPVNNINHIISWDWEFERTYDMSYLSNKTSHRLAAGPGVQVTPISNGRAWTVNGINNNGTLEDAKAKEDYIYGQFTVGSKPLIVKYWGYTSYEGASNDLAVEFDDDTTNFSSPEILSTGPAPVSSCSVNYAVPNVNLSDPSGSMCLISGSVPQVVLKANTTYQVRFYHLKNDHIFEDQIGFGFLEGQCIVNTNIDFDNDGIPNHLDLDSDNDGCLDAIEGGAAITNSQLVDAGGIASVGPGSSAPNKNLCGNSSCVSTSGANIGLPQLALPLPTGYSNDTGQSIGDSQNASVSSQCKLPYCYKPAVTSGTVLDTKHGITALGRAGSGDADKWPMVRKGAWTALEAKTKGFVPNRLAFDASGNPIGIASSNFVEGMMVYDTTNNCLKIYDGTAWKCYTTQTCPD